MKLLKKLTELITPPIFRRESADRLEPYAEGHSLYSLLKPLIKQLLSAASVDDPSAREAVAQIKRIARAKGLYLTAFEMRSQLQATHTLDDQDTRSYKARGYVLAADFILGHIQRELADAKAGAQSIGPNIFSGYCDEMIACLLAGPNVRRAIEIPVTLLDDLLVTALDDVEEGAGAYMVLAEHVLACALQLTMQRFVQQNEKASETPRPRARTETIPSALADPLSTIDEEALNYVAGLQHEVEKISAGFAALASRAPGMAGASRKVDVRIDCLRKALGVANSAKYLAFTAEVKEHLADLLQDAKPEEARELYHGAAECYEAQGQEESQLHFTKLRTIRYKKAHSCFIKSGDTQGAARLQPTGDNLPE